jgi:pilus assembly protein CpaC
MQVMLEVKVAEVSKTVLDKLGAEVFLERHSGNTVFRLLTQFLTGGAGAVGVARNSGSTLLSLDAELRNGLVKILAEPTIMAISGQEGAFLAGGKIFIPVAQGGAGVGGVAAFTLEEKEFGVGLKFTPTVLEGGRINLRVTPEVSELSQIGASFTTAGGAASVLPTITTRRASTTVQLYDGQSFAIGGLIKSNVTEALRKFPGLGEVPVIGALFRSTEFQNERSELLFIITPRLVKPMEGYVALPTDRFVPPTPAEFLLGGQMEGPPPPPPAAAPVAPKAGPAGFELK